MTKKQILTAWSKSSSKEQSVHKTFDEKMIHKTLINTGCNIIINATPEYQVEPTEETTIEEETKTTEKFEDFEEVEATEVVDVTTGEVSSTEAVEEVEEDEF